MPGRLKELQNIEKAFLRRICKSRVAARSRWLRWHSHRDDKVPDVYTASLLGRSGGPVPQKVESLDHGRVHTCNNGATTLRGRRRGHGPYSFCSCSQPALPDGDIFCWCVPWSCVAIGGASEPTAEAESQSRFS